MAATLALAACTLDATDPPLADAVRVPAIGDNARELGVDAWLVDSGEAVTEIRGLSDGAELYAFRFDHLGGDRHRLVDLQRPADRELRERGAVVEGQVSPELASASAAALSDMEVFEFPHSQASELPEGTIGSWGLCGGFNRLNVETKCFGVVQVHKHFIYDDIQVRHDCHGWERSGWCIGWW
jgi:hypothetical protein